MLKSLTSFRMCFPKTYRDSPPFTYRPGVGKLLATLVASVFSCDL
ncbi:hypothetical protein HanPSC8_Chr15g0652781 [Helianthus annuus]|nr:hypothetical protein HanPSC8_Chr15g0652781 [Helianthus annuus]